MPRPRTGQIVERDTSEGRTYALRFTAYGRREYVTLGSDGWTRQRAEEELANVLADVRRGNWRKGSPESVKPEPSFHEFASEWFDGVAPGLKERTQVDYRWRLSSHLLPYFATYRLSAITIEEVDRYRRSKERERMELETRRREQLALPSTNQDRLPRPLSNGSINKTIRLLGVVLEQAVEYGYIVRNPARGRKRLLRESRPSRSYLQPEQVSALLIAAGELDTDARDGDTGRRRPLLATLTLAGLRISEALDLRWRSINLGGGRLSVGNAKTPAGIREVNLTPTLREVLSEYRTRTEHGESGDLVFPTSKGHRDSPSNVRNRLLAKAVENANESLQESAQEPIVGVTPHLLRRTFISLLLATGADVPYVMAQAGHSDPKTTLGIYAQVIASGTDHGTALDGLVGASEWAPIGTTAPEATPVESQGRSA